MIWRLERGLAVGVVAAFAIGLIFYAAYLFPEGGYAHGPRHLVPIVPLAALLAAGPAADRWPRAAWMACGGVGFAIGLLAVSVSFLEDQALRRDARGQVVAGYYEVIDPPPGRANNRYRLGHFPFVTAMDSPRWWQSPALGQGPNYFPRYLRQVRRQLPDGGVIPESFHLVVAGDVARRDDRGGRGTVSPAGCRRVAVLAHQAPPSGPSHRDVSES